jgi:hypothetical protein
VVSPGSVVSPGAGASGPCASHRPVFLAGLHRSGTTALAQLLADHPEVSGFCDTGAKEDEGQHLQSVYPAARTFGGAGRFAFDDRSHLTEVSPLATEANARLLWEQWAPYWDLDRPVLVEKSPPNIVMTRFLQALYPCSRFVLIVRHPIVVALSTQKWRRSQPMARTVAHWVRAHQVFRADAPHLHAVHVVRYEELLTRPDTVLEGLTTFLGLSSPLSGGFDASRSQVYVDQWESLLTSASPVRRVEVARMQRVALPELGHWGYRSDSLTEVDTMTPLGQTDRPESGEGA